jgi:branched-chain amino acid transport system permease protein
MTETLVSAAVAGLVLGGLYGAISIGLSLIFGIIRVVNFAHGAFLMTAMYASYWLWHFTRLDPYLSILVVGPLMFGIGYAVQHLLIRPMFVRERALVVEPLGVLLLMAGLDVVLSNLALLFFRSDYRGIIVPVATATWRLGFVELSVSRTVVLLLAVLLTAGLGLMLRYTDLGAAIRAVGQNREAAALCGVNVYRVYSFTFGLGTAVLAVTGAAMLPFYYVNPAMGTPLAIKSFIVVVLGGLGSVPGALAGGLLLGVVESVAAQFVTATAAAIFSFCLFVAVLLVRPKGLMGTLEI